tara:strand:- start:68 stop:568 length:501 start_codon:yes stop_codon:yes gene_type:complete
MNVYLPDFPLTHDLLAEFIQDAKSKDDLFGEYEIEYFGSDKTLKKFVSDGKICLNSPFQGQISILNDEKKNICIFSVANSIKIFGAEIKPEYEVCLVEEISPISGIKKILGVVYNLTLGIDHGVTVGVDSNGSDWTGYLGGIILSDDEWESGVDESENEDIKNNGE